VAKIWHRLCALSWKTSTCIEYQPAKYIVYTNKSGDKSKIVIPASLFGGI